ncbi:BRO-N domain-containing protein [Virgibacillus proomii]|uniref:BRO-N domain-containing protein n=1 Tax=Virgibacillus proomii TaxID=84407 RepID=UPI000986E9FB|nr:BRO family protein [Virgibacillus proomii]
MNLSLAVKEMFEGNEVEVYWNENNEPIMTIDGLSKALDYSDRSGIQKIVNRNPYLKDIEFSTEDKMSLVEGGRKVTREVRIFNEDGIYEVTLLSKKPKARKFRAFVRELLKSLRKGELQLAKPQTEQDKLQIQKQRAEAMLLNAKTRQAKLILEMQKDKVLSPIAVELLGINAIEHITGKEAKTKPQIEKTYTATEIAKQLGITANKVGRIAKANGLKRDEYGIWALDKAKHSDKQVPSFRYYENAIHKIKELL